MIPTRPGLAIGCYENTYNAHMGCEWRSGYTGNASTLPGKGCPEGEKCSASQVLNRFRLLNFDVEFYCLKRAPIQLDFHGQWLSTSNCLQRLIQNRLHLLQTGNSLAVHGANAIV